MPKGLDFFAAMGVSAAEQILMEEKTDWKALGDSLKSMKKRMGEIDWQETTCTQWMNALKVLTDKEGKDKMPYFMVTPEWDKKDLNAVLASWAELKHDAILYQLLEESHRTARQHRETAEAGEHAPRKGEGRY